MTSDGEIATPALEIGLSQSLEELVDAANQHFARFQQLAGEGDWTGYGREIDALRLTLEQLAAAAGAQPAPPEEQASQPAYRNRRLRKSRREAIPLGAALVRLIET